MTHVSFMCNQITSLPDYSYLTLAAPYTATIEIKKSKFITTAWPATSPDEVRGCPTSDARLICLMHPDGNAGIWTGWPAALLQALQLVAAAKDPAASHNCFAYKIGEQVNACRRTAVMRLGSRHLRRAPP